jgi:hypothetical protein
LRPAVVAPLAPDRYKVQLTIGRETYDKLRRAQDLLRHAIPNGDPAAIVDRALTVLLAALTRRKLTGTGCPPRVASDDLPVAAYSSGGQAGGLGPRWRAVRVRRHDRPVYRDRLSRVSPSRAVCGWWRGGR